VNALKTALWAIGIVLLVLGGGGLCGYLFHEWFGGAGAIIAMPIVTVWAMFVAEGLTRGWQRRADRGRG
jgi:hypothetical protein